MQCRITINTMRMRCVFDGAVELLGLNVRLDDLVVRKRPLGACENRICYIHSSKIIQLIWVPF